MKGGRKYLQKNKNGVEVPFRPTFDLDKFAPAMRAWIANVMPAWRREGVQGGWPLRRVEGGDWSAARKGGQNGFGMVIIACLWWLEAVETAEQKREVKEVVEDLVYALGEMTSSGEE